MSAMAKSLRGFQAALSIGWISLGAAGAGYAHWKGIPGWVALPVIAAILIAYPFYLVTGFPLLRETLAGPRRFPLAALAVMVGPYLACCCGAIPFHWSSLARVAAVGLALGLWYVVLPPNPVVDLAFLALTAVVLLGKYFEPVYPVVQKENLVIVGKVGLYTFAILALMIERRVPETGYGFIPTAREWRIGALHYLYFLVVGLPLALTIRATHLIPPKPLWVVAATFVGFLWFISLTEEFFFRGVLQAWFEKWTHNQTVGLLLTSVVFGLIHYPFRGWGWVLMGGLLGFFCGRARNLSGGIRAGVVTHALVVTTWRAFFA
jgi:uncharacterized protein